MTPARVGHAGDGHSGVEPIGGGATVSRPRRLVGRDWEIVEVNERTALTPLITVTGPATDPPLGSLCAGATALGIQLNMMAARPRGGQSRSIQTFPETLWAKMNASACGKYENRPHRPFVTPLDPLTSGSFG